MSDKNNANKNWFKKHKVATVALIFLIIVFVGSIAGGGDQTSKTDNSSGKKQSKISSESTETLAKLNTPAKDGKFEFTVKSVECGKPSVGSEYLNKTAQGQYCLLNVSIKNIGDKAQPFFSANQKLLNDSKQEYAADDLATSYNNPTASSAYNSINPGNTIEGQVVFDLPKDQTPSIAVLHDSSLSGGIKVSLK